MKIKLYTCVDSNTDYIGLNQIISYWEEKDWIERVHIPMLNDKRFISWVGRVGGLALEPSDVERIATNYEYVLSCQYRSSWDDKKNILPWNFYVRDWKGFYKVQQEISKRNIRSIFSGTIRGDSHNRNIWKDSTEIFSYRCARTYNITNTMFKTIEDYYRALHNSKFSLCPVGDCPICQRETESLGMGCVSVFGEGVEWKYFVSPQENVHFITAKNPEEMNMKIDSMSEENRLYISNNATQYFNKYCSPDGLWNSVLCTIEKYNIKVN